MSEPLEHLRQAYQILKRNVICTLRTQCGADTQLSYQVNEVLQFHAALQLASPLYQARYCLLNHCGSIAT
jgi:hypothetical protein